MSVIRHSEITIAACGRCTTEISRLRGERDAARATVERQAGEVIAVNLQLQGAEDLLREIAERTDVPADFANAVVRLRWVHERATNALGGQ